MLMKNISIKMAASFVFVTAFLLISVVSRDAFGKIVTVKGDGLDYTITMNASNAPTASETYTNTEADIRYSHFEYADAKASAGNHVELNTSGYIKNALDSQITSILSVTAVFSASGTLSLGTSYYGASYSDVTLTSGVSVDLSATLPYYLKLTAVDGSATITSVAIVYSCTPYERPLNAGDKYYFGSYPQTKVTDTTLIATLDSEAGALPSSSDSQAWTSYHYYISSSNTTDFMWYQDVINGSDKYRGVYFVSYRPSKTSFQLNNGTLYQNLNGYYINTSYWFKYEPISWDVLSDDEAEGPLMLASKILDSREYSNSTADSTIDGVTIYRNNYKESAIRSWLNNDFYNQTFTSAEQASINTTTVDNSAASTGSATNKYACENTNDKVFLLSFVEAVSATYGLDTAALRIRQSTDYAKALGVRATSVNSNWWLRSPFGNSFPYYARYISNNGATPGVTTTSTEGIDNMTSYGIIPAFRINL